MFVAVQHHEGDNGSGGWLEVWWEPFDIVVGVQGFQLIFMSCFPLSSIWVFSYMGLCEWGCVMSWMVFGVACWDFVEHQNVVWVATVGFEFL